MSPVQLNANAAAVWNPGRPVIIAWLALREIAVSELAQPFEISDLQRKEKKDGRKK